MKDKGGIYKGNRKDKVFGKSANGRPLVYLKDVEDGEIYLPITRSEGIPESPYREELSSEDLEYAEKRMTRDCNSYVVLSANKLAKSQREKIGQVKKSFIKKLLGL